MTRLKGHKTGWYLKHSPDSLSPFLLDDKVSRKALQILFKARIGTSKFNRAISRDTSRIIAAQSNG